MAVSEYTPHDDGLKVPVTPTDRYLSVKFDDPHGDVLRIVNANRARVSAAADEIGLPTSSLRNWLKRNGYVPQFVPMSEATQDA